MATFETSWTFSGATGILRLVIQDPPAASPGQTAMTLSAWLYLITNGAVSDSTNTNLLEGNIVDPSHAVSVSHAAFPTGGTTLVAAGSATFGLGGGAYAINVTGRINGYNAFAGEKVVSGSVVIPAYISAATVPGSPGTSADTITQNSAKVYAYAPASDGGSPINRYEVYVLSNNAFPGAGGNVVAAAAVGAGGLTATGLTPNTMYFYTAQARNGVGWSSWTTMKEFVTAPSGYVKVGGAWRPATGYVKVAGAWRLISQTYVKVGGSWRTW